MRRIDTATKAVDLFGEGKHGFKNGDPALAILATKLNAEWFNAIQEELAGVIEAAGLAVSPGTYNQLLLALRAAGVFSTPAQFDVSTKAATMEALQRALGSCSGQVSKNSSSTLTGSDVGKEINLIAGAAVTTLPLLSSVPLGAAFDFICTGHTGAVVQRNGADNMSANGSVQASFTLDLGDTLRVVSGGTLWLVVGGTARLKYAAAFGSSLAANGHQKLPSGLIKQWGVAIVTAGTQATVNLPIAFPGGFVSLVSGVNANVATAASFSNAFVVSTAQIKLAVNAGSGVGVYWEATGY